MGFKIFEEDFFAASEEEAEMADHIGVIFWADPTGTGARTKPQVGVETRTAVFFLSGRGGTEFESAAGELDDAFGSEAGGKRAKNVAGGKMGVAGGQGLFAYRQEPRVGFGGEY